MSKEDSGFYVPVHSISFDQVAMNDFRLARKQGQLIMQRCVVNRQISATSGQVISSSFAWLDLHTVDYDNRSNNPPDTVY